MRFVFKLFLLLLLFGLPLALGAAVFLAVDTQPAIHRAAEVTPSSIERAKRILDQNDPRKLKSGARRTISVAAGDLDLAANYLARQYIGGGARVKLRNGSAQVGVSLRMPRLPVRLYLNVDATVAEQAPIPRFDSLRIGRLPIPTWLAHWLVVNGPGLIHAQLELGTLNHIVQKVAIKEHGVAITYQWREDAIKNLRAVVLPVDEQERIAIYQALLVNVAQNHSASKVSLIDFLVPFFQRAGERSTHSNAISENRAAILVLALYVNGKSFERILPDMKASQRPAPHTVLLSQRDDFAKHFIVSAALAASAGSPLADAVGVFKEISDSRGGSGFSFNDIAADRAGSRFGAAAVDGSMLKKVQMRVGAGVNERDLMPATADLPEFMPEAEFKRRFGGVNGVEYNRMMADIERRIAALPLYR